MRSGPQPLTPPPSSPLHKQRPLLLAALAVCAGALALSAAFPRPTSRLEDDDGGGGGDSGSGDARDSVAEALDREARGVTTGVLWGTRQRGTTTKDHSDDD
jgi:hypothetical protein